jgi:thiol-disulfide isomerase/thioredoxin
MKYLIFIAVIFGAGCYEREPIKTGKEGSSIPSFDLLLPDSVSSINTGNIPNGQTNVLIYFGPHCPYSRAQIEDILSNIQTFKDVRFYLFTNWPFRDMKNFYLDYRINKYPNIIMGEDYANYFTKYFDAQGVPYLAFYDKNKRLIKAFVGKIDYRQIRKIVNE